MSADASGYTRTGEKTVRHRGREYRLYTGPALSGPRFVLDRRSAEFPSMLKEIPRPPERLYVIGKIDPAQEGLAVIGARRATPYGLGCTRRFAGIAAAQGISIVSGGAYGCDSEAHKAALESKGHTIAFLGGGCDRSVPGTIRPCPSRFGKETGLLRVTPVPCLSSRPACPRAPSPQPTRPLTPIERFLWCRARSRRRLRPVRTSFSIKGQRLSSPTRPSRTYSVRFSPCCKPVLRRRLCMGSRIFKTPCSKR